MVCAGGSRPGRCDAVSHILIQTNPTSGRGRGPRLAAAVCRELANTGYEPVLHTEPPTRISADQMLDDRLEAIVVVGGDGTLRDVAERMCELGPPSRWRPLLPVPLGTANLMARHLGFPDSEKQAARRAVAALQRGSRRALDAAAINGRLFLLMAGVGVDAWIVHELTRRRRGPISKLSYVRPAFASLRHYRFHPVSVRLDGREVFGPEPAIVFIANVPEYGTGFPMLPGARPDDGKLDVLIVPTRSQIRVAATFALAAVRQHVRLPGAILRHATRVEIESDQPLPVQADGDVAGHTPARIELLPLRLPFIVARDA